MHKQTDGFIIVVCPGCGSGNFRPAFEKYGFFYRSCGRCATIYMSPRPSPAIMADYYAHSENYAHWAKYIFPASEASRREKIHKPWLERVVRLCNGHAIFRGTLLEVGPGFGTFAAVAAQSEAFSRVIAVEPTPEMALACRARGVTVLEKRIETVGKGHADEPGYDDILSRSHNPFVLQQLARQVGLLEVRLLFYHYHALPPMLETLLPDLFRRESLALEDPLDWRGYFMASAFILTGQRL